MEFKTILCPVDFSHISSKSLKQAAMLAQKHQARLLVMHVIPRSPWMLPPVPTMPVDPVQFQEHLRQPAQVALEDLIRKEVPSEVQVELVLDMGLPAHVITAVAQEKKADLIVIASREDTTLDRLLFGSVAEKVIRAAPCSVLVLKHLE